MAHKFNYLKYKMLKGLLEAYPSSLTVIELADRIGVDPNCVRVSFTRWKKKGIPYARRLLKSRHPRIVYQYRITQSGIKAYIDFKNRIEHHLTLNRLKKMPTVCEQYETAQPTRRERKYWKSA